MTKRLRQNQQAVKMAEICGGSIDWPVPVARGSGTPSRYSGDLIEVILSGLHWDLDSWMASLVLKQLLHTDLTPVFRTLNYSYSQ